MPLVAAPAVRRQAYDTRPFLAGWCMYGLLLALLGWLLLGSSSAVYDFKSFYTAGYLCRTHPATLYDLQAQQRVQDSSIGGGFPVLPYFHPAYESVLFVPFSYLPYKGAYFAFMGFNFALLLAIFLLSYRLFAVSIPLWSPRPGLMLFLYLPLMLAIWHGQDTLVYLLIAALTWQYLEEDRDCQAGSVLALGLFRFQLAIPLALLLMARRGWRFAAGFIAAGASLVVLSVALVGRESSAAFVRLIAMAGDPTAARGLLPRDVMNTHPLAMPDIFGLLYGLTSYLPAGAGTALVLTVSLAVFAGCLYVVRRTQDERVAFSVAILCSALVSYHMYVYSLAVLLIPVALLGARLHKGVLLAFYAAAMVTPMLGKDWIFLLALPTLALLWNAVRLEPAAVAQPSTV